MLHVIEHLPDPLATLREINRVLKPRGYLVLETPRYDSLMYKVLGRRERSLRCDGHIYFYTTDTLRRTYEAANFELVQLDYVGRSLTFDRLSVQHWSDYSEPVNPARNQRSVAPATPRQCPIALELS